MHAGSDGRGRRHNGSAHVDLWRYRTSDGRGIRKALDYLVPFARGEKVWQNRQITRLEPKDLVPELIIAAARYGDPGYEALARQLAGAETVPADRLSLLLAR